MSQSFAFPSFHDYPPFYTNARTTVSEDLDLFHNRSIERKAPPEAKRAFFQWLVDRGDSKFNELEMFSRLLGNGAWKDGTKDTLLVLWKTIPQWTETLLQWVYDFGLEDSVITVDEISHGEETAGSELEGLDRDIIIQAIERLEQKGKAKLFKGSSQDDIGIKFFK